MFNKIIMPINITIITAAWRVSGLKNVIECINNQSYKGRIEHIIVNDNNPEVREFLKENNYFENNEHRHVIDSHTRFHYYGGINRGMATLAAFSYIREQERDEENEWICYLDDDANWEKNHLQSYIDIIEKNSNATLIGSDMIRVGANDKNWRGIVPCVIAHGQCDLGCFLYKALLFRKYGFFYPRPKRKQRYDFELIKKIVDGEKENVFFTKMPTFISSYRKK